MKVKLVNIYKCHLCPTLLAPPGIEPGTFAVCRTTLPTWLSSPPPNTLLRTLHLATGIWRLYASYSVYCLWHAIDNSDNTGQPISERLQFYLGEVKLGVNSSRSSEIEVLDDVSARLSVHNVSRDVSGRHVTCLVTGYDVDHVVSSDVNIRVAGTPYTALPNQLQ